MTPQERQMMAELFNRLANLENSPRDRDAEAMIREGFRRAPNAAYSLVQTVLLQDEALKAANAHIQEYEQQHGAPQQQEQPRGFLDNMRDSLFGREEPRGSVPRVPQAGAPPPGYRSDPWGQGGQGGYQQGGYQQGAPMQAPPQQGGGGSFLGTAAAAAVGVIGGSMLANSIGGLMGGQRHGFGDTAGLGGGQDRGSPWSGDQSKSELAREAGLNDIGRGGGDRTQDASGSRQGLFDQASNENQDDDDDYDSDDDFDSGDSDSDYA
jgi:hypothetical protein